MPFSTTRRDSGSSSNRSASPMSIRSDDSSTTSSSRRGRAASILRSLRGGSRGSSGKQQKERNKSVLDVLQNIRLRSSSNNYNSRHDSDDATAATSTTPSLASTAHSTLGSGPGTFQRTAHSPFSRLPAKQMRTQNHKPPSLATTVPPPPTWGAMQDGRRSMASLNGNVDRTKRIRAEPSSSVLLTPLYNAVSAGAPRHVVERVIQQNTAASYPANGCMTALHCAIERYDTKIDVLLLILASNPTAAGIRCADDFTCVDLLWKRFVEPAEYRSEGTKANALALRRKIEEVVDSPFAMHRQMRAQHAIEENPDLKECWDTIVVFIKAAACHFNGTYAGRPTATLLVHDCVELDCDPLLVRFAAALHPDHVSMVVNDERQLPLHVAAMKASPRAFKAVLGLYPQAASRADGDGRLPLHHALERGRTWEDGVEDLIRASPRSFVAPDPKTGLPPVLQAACAPSNDLTTVYNMLSANPMEMINYITREE